MTVPGVYSPEQGEQKRKDPIVDWGNRIIGLVAILGVSMAFLNIAMRADMKWGDWLGFAVMLYVAVTSIWVRWVR